MLPLDRFPWREKVSKVGKITIGIGGKAKVNVYLNDVAPIVFHLHSCVLAYVEDDLQ